MDISHPTHWRRVLPYWPVIARQRWGEIANRYQEAGFSWQEAEWRAFRFIASDLSRFEQENPHLVERAYKDINPGEDLDIPLCGLLFDKHQFPIPSAEWFEAYLQRCRDEEAALPFPRDVEAEKEETRQRLAAMPKMALEKRSTKQISSKPKKEAKPKAEKSAKRSKHDPGVGSLF